MAVRDDGSLRDGVWLLPDGNGCYLDESRATKPDELPARIAMKVIQHLMGLYAMGEVTTDLFNVERMREWIDENPPPPESDPEPEDERWVNMVMAMAVLCGLTLVWRGGITTTLKGVAEVSQLVRNGAAEISRLAWPAESIIAVTTVSEKAEAESELVSLGVLTGEMSADSGNEVPAMEFMPSQQPASAADALKTINHC